MDVACSGCGKNYSIPPSGEGKDYRCKACGGVVSAKRAPSSETTSESIEVACPGCGKKYRLPPSAQNKQYQCNACSAVVSAGPVAQSPSRPAAPRPAPTPQIDLNDPSLWAIEASAPAAPVYHSPRPAPGPVRQPAASSPPPSAYRPSDSYSGSRKKGGGASALKQWFIRSLIIRFTFFFLLVMIPGCGCLGAIVAGIGSMIYRETERNARTAELAERIDDFCSIPDLDTSLKQLDISTAGEDQDGYIRGKFVLVAPDDRRIHHWHTEIDDPRLAWKPEEVETVIWLQSQSRTGARYRDDKGREWDIMEQTITFTVIDLPAKKVVGRFRMSGESPDEVSRLESLTAGNVKREDAFPRIQGLPDGPPADN